MVGTQSGTFQREMRGVTTFYFANSIVISVARMSHLYAFYSFLRASGEILYDSCPVMNRDKRNRIKRDSESIVIDGHFFVARVYFSLTRKQRRSVSASHSLLRVNLQLFERKVQKVHENDPFIFVVTTNNILQRRLIADETWDRFNMRDTWVENGSLFSNIERTFQ